MRCAPAGGRRDPDPLILVLDNYDSFTWNLVQILRQLGAPVEVARNDAVDGREVAAGGYGGILISPGPGRPREAGVSEDLIRVLGGKVPILGVCLGHQALAHAAGGRIVRAPAPMHGKTSLIHHDGRGIFRGMPTPFRATRYHSLVVEAGSLPAGLEISATTADGLVMGLRRRAPGEAPLEGVQFHPESILTLGGTAILANFVEQARAALRGRARGSAGRERMEGRIPGRQGPSIYHPGESAATRERSPGSRKLSAGGRDP